MTVTSANLATFLDAAVDEARANLVILQAVSLCKAELRLGETDALPTSADAVVLSCAARAYVNPTSRTSQLAGPFQVTGAAGGIFLTKQERMSLKRVAGRSGAFSINTLPAAYTETEEPAP